MKHVFNKADYLLELLIFFVFIIIFLIAGICEKC